MITLATLKDATAQEVFDQIVDHLRNQGCKSIADNRCLYRNGQLKCAAGCLIGDDEYSPLMEGGSWSVLISMRRIPSDHEKLIDRMQFVHDQIPINDWELGLKHVAQQFDLTYHAPKNN